MQKSSEIGVGLMGLGVVGSGVARALVEKQENIANQVGRPVTLRRILEKDLQKPRPSQVSPSLLTADASKVLEDPEVDIVVELLGGEHPAIDYIQRAITLGKHVVTANKEVMAKGGVDILAMAHEKGVQVLFEASVGGGIPIIGPLMKDLLANEIESIHAIINGTTNYILTKMAQDGVDFSAALAQAQELGYAEADPANDVEGVDAAYKLAILSTLAFHTHVRYSDVYHEGITRLKARDFRYAQELGYAIKLMAIGHRDATNIQVRVHPAFVPQDVIIAKVDGVFNAVEITADLAGRVFFHGMGAGSIPTSSAVIGNIMEIARNISLGANFTHSLRLAEDRTIRSMESLETKYYIRMNVADRPGVFAKIATVLGELEISIASVIQKEVDERSQTAEIVIMTHPAKEASVQKALQRLEDLDVVDEVGNMVRVEEWPS